MSHGSALSSAPSPPEADDEVCIIIKQARSIVKFRRGDSAKRRSNRAVSRRALVAPRPAGRLVVPCRPLAPSSSNRCVSPVPPTLQCAAAAAAGGCREPRPAARRRRRRGRGGASTVARPQTMTSDMQDMAISIAMEALLKNNSETDVAADIKAAFESNTLTTRARGVARRRRRAARDAFRPRAGGTASSGATSRATSRTRRRVSRTSTSARSASASSPRTRGRARAPADATSRRLRPPRRDEHGRLPGLWTPPAGSARSDRKHGTRRIM